MCLCSPGCNCWRAGHHIVSHCCHRCHQRQHQHLSHQHHHLHHHLHHHPPTSWNPPWAKHRESLLMPMSLRWPQGSSTLFLLCLPPCSLSSHNGFLAAFDSTRHVPTVGPLHWLFSYWSTLSPPPYPLTHLFQVCSSITFSVRLTLTILFNHTTFLSFTLLISTTLLYRGNFSR